MTGREQAENVFPDTIAKIHHARSLSNRPWEERMTPFANIGALLTARAAETPDKNFLAYYDNNGKAAEYTYAEFAEAVRRVAAFMTGPLGLRAGDRVATLMVNDARTVLVYFAAWLLGATVVPINCAEDDERVGFILDNSEAKAAFVLSGEIERCALLREQCKGIQHYVQVGGSARGEISRPLTAAVMVRS